MRITDSHELHSCPGALQHPGKQQHGQGCGQRSGSTKWSQSGCKRRLPEHDHDKVLRQVAVEVPACLRAVGGAGASMEPRKVVAVGEANCSTLAESSWQLCTRPLSSVLERLILPDKSVQ
jgi:hypothetical protein